MAERFNAGKFAGLREMLGQDVRVGPVARRKPMQRHSAEYFTNYGQH